MPVQSKSISGREKKPPPTPRPKPILKTRRVAWTASGSSEEESKTNSKDECSDSSSQGRFSLLPKPYVKGPQPYTQNSPTSPTVQFQIDEGTKDASQRGFFNLSHKSIFKKSGQHKSIDHKSNQRVSSNQGGGSVIQNGVTGEDSLGETDQSSTSETSGATGPSVSQARVSAGIRTSFCGLEALQECEEHTDWANEILRRNNLPLISDLRKSISDGVTLPAILEIISGVTLHCVQTSVCTKEERVQNLGKCLQFLSDRGAEVTHIDPAELEDGSLKTSLLLVGTVRKQFENSYKPTQNGHVDHTDHVELAAVASTEPVQSKPPPLPPRGNMPGATKLAGAVPTPFMAGQGTLQRTRQGLSTSPTRKGVNQNEEILPGVLGGQTAPGDQNNKPHTAIISTTELGTNGVAQHGVEERRQHLASSSPTGPGPGNRSVLLRHPNAKTGAPVVQEMANMPHGVTRAWTGSPRPQAQNGGQGGTVEDRLRQLITSNQSKAAAAHGRDTQQAHYNGGGGGGMFHGGGSEVFDDGDVLIVPPPPQSRNRTPDFEIMMVGNHSYGPGYRHPGQSPRGQGQRSQGYVPSRPTERHQGARADALIGNTGRPPQGAHYQQRPGPQTSDMVPGTMHGQDNFAYTGECQGQGQAANRTGASPSRQIAAMARPGGQQRPGGNDLRNAWNKLYGRPPQSGQVSPAMGPMSRGDNLRSSYGPESQNRGQQSPHPYRSKPANQSHLYNRPVSAPAPAHMHVQFDSPPSPGPAHHFPSPGLDRSRRSSQDHMDYQGRASLNTSANRESPMGQSSSTQGQLEESTSSQQSGNSQPQGAAPGHQNQFHPAGDGYPKHISSPSLSPSSPQSSTSQTFAIGPAAKYPESNSRPSSARKPPDPADPGRSHFKDMRPSGKPSWDEPDLGPMFRGHNSVHKTEQGGTSGKRNFASDLTTALQAASKVHNQKSSGNHNGSHHNQSYDRLHERSYEQSREMQDHSIFDYEASHSETSGSVTPPLPPLSPTNTPPDSPVSETLSPLPRSFSATNVSSGDKVSELEHLKMAVDKKKPRRTSELQFRLDRKPHSKKTSGKQSGFKSKGANLKEVRESESESDLSFDIENTILTVESHDTEQPHPAGDILTSHEAAALRQQLHELETKYRDLKTVTAPPGTGHAGHHGHPQGPGPPLPIGRQRRWSIGSSDTSSFRREAKYKPGKQIQHKHHSREFKNINKRFQRLESHVVTLARSVAHLSSELRTHNSMVHDLDAIKKDLREVRDSPGRMMPGMMGGMMCSSLTEEDRGLTNPKRVNKLTKFFGEEPPLLQLFLEKLGYKRYVPNFQSEHIGMIELPYMTEDRLEKIGVPMGPRLRILQEAQICFKHENLNIYMV